MDDNENKKEEQKANDISKGDELSLREQFLRLFDDEFWKGQILPNIFSRPFFPRVDISENDTEIMLVADLPGVDPQNIEIDVRDSRVKISGFVDKEKSGDMTHRYERSHGEFEREFSLPSKVKEDGVKARYKDGVLTVILPKSEDTKRRKIEIEKI